MVMQEGMDAEAVRQVAAKLDSQVSTLNGIIATISTQVGHATSIWHGRDAHDFAGWWSNQHKPALTAAATAIAGLASSARNNASAQDAASGVSGSSVAGVGVAATAALAGAAGAATVAASAPAAPPPPTESGPQGTQQYSAQRSVDLARAEARAGFTGPTGYNQEGECVKSVQRWIGGAGGHFGGGGVVSSYTNSGAVAVGMNDVRPGDVLQFTSTTSPDAWEGKVHTVLVAGTNADGTLDIVQSNSKAPGLVNEVSSWTPKQAAGWEWKAWRFEGGA